MPLDITWPTASAITYGEPLGFSDLSGGGAKDIGQEPSIDILGKFSWDDPTLVPSAGNRSCSMTFTPDEQSYDPVSGIRLVRVYKAIPYIQPGVTASAITYGQSLNSSKVTGDVINPCSEVSVSGIFRFSAPKTIPPVSTKRYPVIFTPTDTSNYFTTQDGANVTVKKATPKVTTPPSSSIKAGRILNTFKLTGGKARNPTTGKEIAGSFVWSSPNAKAAPKGKYTAKFIPTDKANYNSSNPCTVNVKIANASLLAMFFM